MSELATQYFIKAKDNYPYDLPEAMESLAYALSYNDEHAGAHSLMGQFYCEQVKNYTEGFYHFEQALLHDIGHIDTYYHYSMALIRYGDYDKAKKLLNYAESVRGICKACILERKALIHELKGNFCKAEKQLCKAVLISINNEEIAWINSIIERVKKKKN